MAAKTPAPAPRRRRRRPAPATKARRRSKPRKLGAGDVIMEAGASAIVGAVAGATGLLTTPRSGKAGEAPKASAMRAGVATLAGVGAALLFGRGMGAGAAIGRGVGDGLAGVGAFLLSSGEPARAALAATKQVKSSDAKVKAEGAATLTALAAGPSATSGASRVSDETRARLLRDARTRMGWAPSTATGQLVAGPGALTGPMDVAAALRTGALVAGPGAMSGPEPAGLRMGTYGRSYGGSY